MDFERQKPVTDEYRENWTRIYGFPIFFGPDIRLRNISIPETYLNGCPILTEERVDG